MLQSFFGRVSRSNVTEKPHACEPCMPSIRNTFAKLPAWIAKSWRLPALSAMDAQARLGATIVNAAFERLGLSWRMWRRSGLFIRYQPTRVTISERVSSQDEGRSQGSHQSPRQACRSASSRACENGQEACSSECQTGLECSFSRGLAKFSVQPETHCRA